MYYDNFEKDLKKILDGDGCVELDFSIPEHAAFFLKSHGGEALLKTQFQGIYNAFCQTRRLHLERSANSGVQGTTGTKPYSCSVEVPYIGSTAPLAENRAGGENLPISASARANVSLEDIGAVYMDGFVEEVGTRNHYVSIWDEFDSESLKASNGRCVSTGEGMVPNPGQKEFRTFCSFDYMDKSGKFLYTVVAEVDSTGAESIIEPVELFEVKAPIAKKGHKNIIVSYKDRPQFDPDYPYYDIEPEGGNVEVLLPIEGEITFKKDYKPVSFCQRRSRPISLAYDGDLSVNYGYTMQQIAPKFKIDGQKVTFALDKDWLATFSVKKFAKGLTASLDCPFRYTVNGPDTEGENKNHDVPLSVTSNSELPEGVEYYKSHGRDVYVPKIEYHWGCFGKHTKIQMADGTQKTISEMKEGEWVSVYEDEPRKVLRLTGGTEKKLVHIETQNGSHIALTDTHPILTGRGIAMASEVSPADRMVMADGTTSLVRFVYVEDYNDQIYNLDLGMDAAHLIFADGFVAGDLGSQNNAIRQKDEETRPSPEADRLFAEMTRLRETLMEANIK